MTELLSQVDAKTAIAFASGILASEGFRRILAALVKAWGHHQVLSAAATPDPTDDAAALAKAEAADQVAAALTAKKDSQ